MNVNVNGEGNLNFIRQSRKKIVGVKIAMQSSERIFRAIAKCGDLKKSSRDTRKWTYLLANLRCVKIPKPFKPVYSHAPRQPWSAYYICSQLAKGPPTLPQVRSFILLLNILRTKAPGRVRTRMEQACLLAWWHNNWRSWNHFRIWRQVNLHV